MLRTMLITVFVILREHMMMPELKNIYWSVILMRCGLLSFRTDCKEAAGRKNKAAN